MRAAARLAALKLSVAVGLVLCAGTVPAQEFGVYLNCKGQVQANGRSKPAQLDLALRRNSQLVMVQSSDILPAGERMKLSITPQFYTMVFKAPVRGSVLFYDWLRGALLVWSPYLENLHTIRISVNRQSAALDGDLRDGAGAALGRLTMICEPSDNESVPEPKF